MPGGILHQHPAQRRAEQRADLARQGDEGHRRHILIARDDLHHRQAADRHHHRAADPCSTRAITSWSRVLAWRKTAIRR